MALDSDAGQVDATRRATAGHGNVRVIQGSFLASGLAAESFDVITAPATMERTSWWENRRLAAQHLPTARLRRHLLWRYTLVWDKP